MSRSLSSCLCTCFLVISSHTLLQRITTRVTWAINFRLHPFQISGLRELKLSDRTRSLACSLEQIRIDLVDSIKKDLRYHKLDILAERRAEEEGEEITKKQVQRQLDKDLDIPF